MAAESKSPRVSWFDDKGQKPVIEQYARQLDSFIQAMADGIIEESEVQQQEAQLIAAMKEVEPLLDEELHAKVTRLLCELTAYDLMQTLHAMQQGRSQATFRG